jgi:putative heme iron utilization protein
MAGKQVHDFYPEARLLIRNARTATLATVEAGMPHAALVTVAEDALRPILLLSELAIHTRQLLADPACALLLTGALETPNPQTTKRLCLKGRAERTDSETARSAFLRVHPYAADYAGFGDFAFWQVVPAEAYYIGGFGAARMLDIAAVYMPNSPAQELP